jgi:hypothetical protein
MSDYSAIAFVGGWGSSMSRHRMFSIVDRTQIPISRTGLDQVGQGKVVTSQADRAGLAELLQLIARPEVSAILISLLLPAIQKAQ